MTDKYLEALINKIRNHTDVSDQEAAVPERMFPEQEFEWIREAGLLSMQLSPATMEYRNGGTENILRVLQKLGSASLPVGRIFEGHVNALQLINLFGNAQQMKSYFTQIFEKQFLMGVWNTQDTDGVRIHEIAGGRYRLEGSKTFCSGASWIQLPLITGELIGEKTKGWQMCIVPHAKVCEIKADGTKWRPLGMRTSASFKMDFTGIILDQQDLLGPVGAYYQQPYFSGGAIRFAAVQLGAAQAILQETHHFLKASGRGNDPFQKARFAEMGWLVETGNLWVQRAGRLTDSWQKSPDQGQQLVAYVNMARTVVADICTKCMELAERSVGVRSMMQPHPLERIHRDLTTYLKQPAPDATIMSVGQYVLDQQDTSSLWGDFENQSISPNSGNNAKI